MRIKKEDEVQFRASRVNGLDGFWYVIEWRKSPKNRFQSLFNSWRRVRKYSEPVYEYENPHDSINFHDTYAETYEVEDILNKYKRYSTYGDFYENEVKPEEEKYDKAVKAYNAYWETHHRENVIY